MFLQRIQIKRFRGIHDLSIDLDELTVLIGSNNTGKTTVLDALQACLSRPLSRRTGIFTDFDYHLPNKDAQPQDAEPIEITLDFSERKEGEWSEEIIQILREAISVLEDGRQGIFLRMKSAYNQETGDFQTTREFLDPKGNSLPKATEFRFLNNLQRMAPVFYLAALRDAGKQFRAQSEFWVPFVRSLKMDDAERDEIESALAELNKRVLDSHEAFGPVLERLSKTGSIVPMSGEDSVSIEAVPSKVFDMLSRTQVLLSGKSGARLPINRHGEGTQSLAVICLFDAFLEAKLADGYTPQTEPILALEEPEAHLHPSAVRAVGALLSSLRGQKVIASHSGDLIASVPITALRRLSRVDGKIRAYHFNSKSLRPDQIQKLDHHVRHTRGGLLFAPFWLMVEGETEVLLFQECARVLGTDLFSAGVSCVEFSRVGVEEFAVLADQLGIDWLVFVDKDPAGDGYVRSAKRVLNGRNEADHIQQCPVGDIEQFLCAQGYGHVYESHVSPQKKGSITAKRGTPEYWFQVISAQPNKSKPRLAAEVIQAIEQKGPAGVPQLIREVTEAALNRAGAAG